MSWMQSKKRCCFSSLRTELSAGRQQTGNKWVVTLGSYLPENNVAVRRTLLASRLRGSLLRMSRGFVFIDSCSIHGNNCRILVKVLTLQRSRSWTKHVCRFGFAPGWTDDSGLGVCCLSGDTPGVGAACERGITDDCGTTT